MNYKKDMHKRSFFTEAIFFLSMITCATSNGSNTVVPATWTVVGAGPVGIAAVGLILDKGVAPENIVWIDIEFNVGRMGKYYRNVPGNSTVRQYIDFLKTCKIFQAVQSDSLNHLLSMPLDQTPELKFIVDPLLDITRYLTTKVRVIKDEMVALDCYHDQWHLKTKEVSLLSENVVLATGAHPKTMLYEGIPVIPLDLALDKKVLATYIQPEDTVAVIGSSHSALLVVKHLTELSVDSIINFYKKPITYPTIFRGRIAWQESGLKGDLAIWTKTVLEKNKPANVLRVDYDSASFESLLKTCTKIIYALGYERNNLPSINGDASVYDKYDVTSGIIAPRLFGLGIAFPEEHSDALGTTEPLVGLPYLTFGALLASLEKNNKGIS